MSKKVICVAAVVIAVVLVLILIGNINNILLFQMMNRLENTVSAHTEILDRTSVYGKLNGNGNGIHFFGAVLIADVPEEEIRQIVDELSGKYEVADYAKQEGNEIHLKYLEHRQPRFSQSAFEENKEYYIIYFFESQHPLAWSLDLAGH